MLKTILCYGDSNVWGRNPVDGTRFTPSVRWPGVLLEHLGKGFSIIEEGLTGRTTVLNDPIEGHSKNGRMYLEPCLASHAPIDLVIFMLGTSDMKKRFSLTAFDIALGLEHLVRMVQQSGAGPNGEAPEILLLTPIPFGPGIANHPRYEEAEAIQHHLPPLYEKLGKQYECAVLETGKFVTASSHDSLHLDAEGHKKLGTAIAAMVNVLLD